MIITDSDFFGQPPDLKIRRQ